MPFVEQTRPKVKAKAKVIVAARVVARAAARNNESELSDLQSSHVELTAPLSPVLASPASPVSPVSPALQLRPRRAQKVPARYQG